MRIIEHIRARQLRTLFVSILVVAAATIAAADSVSNWNITAARAVLLAGQNGIVSSRSLAMTQVAVHDALNAIDRRYETYTLTGDTDPGASADAAVATAAHDALVALIPVGALPFGGFGSLSQQTAAVDFVQAVYAADIATIQDGPAKTRGIAVGHASALAILARRSTDGATAFIRTRPGRTLEIGSPLRIRFRLIPRQRATGSRPCCPGGEASLHSFSDRPINSGQTGHRPSAAS